MRPYNGVQRVSGCRGGGKDRGSVHTALQLWPCHLWARDDCPRILSTGMLQPFKFTQCILSRIFPSMLEVHSCRKTSAATGGNCIVSNHLMCRPKCKMQCLQVPDLDVLIVPVSGCGMISGISVAAKGLKPDILVIAAEPTGVSFLLLAFSHGSLS